MLSCKLGRRSQPSQRHALWSVFLEVVMDGKVCPVGIDSQGQVQDNWLVSHANWPQNKAEFLLFVEGVLHLGPHDWPGHIGWGRPWNPRKSSGANFSAYWIFTFLRLTFGGTSRHTNQNYSIVKKKNFKPWKGCCSVYFTKVFLANVITKWSD